MSGLSNFLGNVYGENEEPDDEGVSDLPPEDQARTESLDDVKESMEALVRGLEEASADDESSDDPADTDDTDLVAPPAPETTTAAAPSADDWFAAIDTPPAVAEPEPPAAETVEAAEDVSFETDDAEYDDLVVDDRDPFAALYLIRATT